VRTKPSYPQRIALKVLAAGGYLTTGVPQRMSPSLYRADGCLFSLVPRQTLDALIARGWVGFTAGRYEVTANGRAMAARHIP
jgi:hypothetical protein